jgi:transposase
MKRFIEGENRDQVTLLPECLDDYVGEDNPVRVVDAFVDELRLDELGFEGVTASLTGRPGYHPAVLLKLYIYGYLNRIQSSRRLERECQRNVEVMWLTRRLAPDFKTIADFRKDNGKGIRNACRRFVMLCRELKLLSHAAVAIDGSKFKAVNNRERNYTPGKVERREREIEESIQRYLDALETADRTQPVELPAKTEQLKGKIEKMRERLAALRAIKAQLEILPDHQLSMTDPDARAMTTHSMKGTALVGYNVQTAVDTEHHLIVAHEVTNTGSDRAQLSKMAIASRDAMGVTDLQAFADRGYYNGPELKACEDAGIAAYVPKPATSSAKADGRFDKADFVYDATSNEYRCPAGSRAIWRHASLERDMKINRYWSSDCPRCPIKAQCTPSPYRRISRWEHEAVTDAVQQRLDRKQDAMKLRKRTVEHVFGTLKHWMGWTHFLTRGMDNVSTEMSLHVLSYNLRRVMNILGVTSLIQAMRLMGA